MPAIRIAFHGYVTANVTSLYCIKSGKNVDVSYLNFDEVMSLIQDGTHSLSLKDLLNKPTDDTDIEFTQYDDAET